jgi:hypothetical protein
LYRIVCFGHGVSFAAMKVLDGLSGGVEPGTPVPLAELGLPATGTHGLLLVFWKAT